MTKQLITISDNAAKRIKEILSNAESGVKGVRVSVKAGGCAGMEYEMNYLKKQYQMMKWLMIMALRYLLIQRRLCICLELKWITKKINFHPHLSLIILTKQSVVAVVSLLKFKLFS